MGTRQCVDTKGKPQGEHYLLCDRLLGALVDFELGKLPLLGIVRVASNLDSMDGKIYDTKIAKMCRATQEGIIV